MKVFQMTSKKSKTSKTYEFPDDPDDENFIDEDDNESSVAVSEVPFKIS